MLALALLLIGSGCTTTQQISSSGLDVPKAIPQSPEIDPDLEPLVSEPEISLDQELKALASTGSWEEVLVPIEETDALAHVW